MSVVSESYWRRCKRLGSSRWMLTVLLSVLSVAAFVPAWNGPFLFDDIALVSRNPDIESPDVLMRMVQSDLFQVDQSKPDGAKLRSYYRPLVVLSYALNWWFFPHRPEAFHVVNLLLHVAVCVLAFRFLERVLKRPVLAFWAAAVFAIHPSKPESVAWISGRTDILACLFLLIAGWAMHKQLNALPRTKERYGFVTLKWTAACLAAFSKETVVVLPGFFLAELWVFLGSPDVRAWKAHAAYLARHLAPAVAFSGGYLLLRAWLMPFGKDSLLVPSFGMQHAQLVLATLGESARMLFLPADMTLYATRLVVGGGTTEFETPMLVLGAGMALCLAGLLIWGYLRDAMVFLWTAAAIVFLLPTSQLAPTGLVYITQARFLYLPLLAIAPLLLWGLRHRRALLSLVGFLLVSVCLILSLERSADFSSEKRFWRAELARNPTVPEVLERRMKADVVAGGNLLAVRRALCAATLSERRHGAASVGTFVLFALDRATSSLPDGSYQIRAAADILKQVRSGGAAQLQAPLAITLPDNSSTARDLRTRKAETLTLEARLVARIPERTKAMELGAVALEVCSTCLEEHRSLSKMALLAGDAAGVERFSVHLSREERQALSSARGRWLEAQTLPGKRRAWALLELGLSVDEPDFSYRVVANEVDAILSNAPEEVVFGVAQAASLSGQLDDAFRLFFRLGTEKRQVLEAAGWPDPISDRSEDFVRGTCALPSELPP